jgi:hypothetical protein
MPDTTPNTDQQETAPVPTVAEATPVAAAQPPAKPEEDDADDADDAVEGEEGEEVPRTEFMNLKDALVMGRKQLQSKHFGNAANLRQFLIMDLYPILIEITDFANWYVGDLHNRVMGLEMGEGGDGGEALAPETAEQLINFIGMSLQIFGVILQSPKADPKLLQVAQILTAQAPGLIAKVQEITMSEEDEDEDEDYEDEDYEDGDEDSEDSEVEDEPGAEPTEVLEPRKREPVQAVPEQPEAQKAETEAPAEASVSVEKPAEVTPVEAGKDEEPAQAAEAPAPVEAPATPVNESEPQPDVEKEPSDG